MKYLLFALLFFVALEPAEARGGGHASSHAAEARFSIPHEGSPDVRHTENPDGEASRGEKNFREEPSAVITEPPKDTVNRE